jgi:hypothetical protein
MRNPSEYSLHLDGIEVDWSPNPPAMSVAAARVTQMLSWTGLTSMRDRPVVIRKSEFRDMWYRCTNSVAQTTSTTDDVVSPLSCVCGGERIDGVDA